MAKTVYHLLPSVVIILFILAPADVSLLTTESQFGLPRFCTRTSYHVVEGDQPAKLCMQLLGPTRGTVNADLTLLDRTTRGVCVVATYSQVCLKLTAWWSIRTHASGWVLGLGLG